MNLYVNCLLASNSEFNLIFETVVLIYILSTDCTGLSCILADNSQSK